MQALLHDAAEVYINDISSPIKRLSELAGYREIEGNIQKAIYRKYGLPEIESANVKRADLMALELEARSLMKVISPEWKLSNLPMAIKVVPLSPKDAETLFKARYTELVIIEQDSKKKVF